MNSLFEYILRIGDDSLILGQRLAEWCGHGPILEEDIALTNISLDLIGQATNFFNYAAVVENAGRDADQLAFLRIDREYKNTVLVEQPNGDFGDTMVRQFLFDAFRKLFFEKLQYSKDEQLAAIAEKSLKETRYHLKHSSEWVIRLGDGTEESHNRVQNSLNILWRYRTELFFMDEVDAELIKQGIAIDLNTFRNEYDLFVSSILDEATLTPPVNNWSFGEGRIGKHSEHLGHLLAEMQYMQRAYPNMEW
ncbi:MAG: phenylacetate-CoA oxygenase subunit PaaC [Crocinitomicaceae bacterium]|nr:phenylacetate-CoA oxygenase subunit PaaC [Crocinitomicaceae bacterium]MCF8443685.1 phenylacetate-CoA oxygenase subunit PaaC [Crocinitomicaceae bacterium]